MFNPKYRAFIIAFLGTVPGICMRLFHPEINPMLMAFLTGMAILSASFMLMWACDVAQMDIPQTLAVAVVALIAVLPEYAVDMYFTWMAGKDPQSDYAHYAIANMTGANRLLIGVGWSLIVIIFAVKHKCSVKIDAERRTELAFLGLATLYALFITVKGTLTLVDSAIFIAIYLLYINIIARRPAGEPDIHGPALVLAAMPTSTRKKATWGLFAFAALVILCDAELFSESLVASGKILGINEFLLVQWLAPIASEAPEFIVAIMFALRGHANIALGSLLSSKLNQWTLLVGMIPIVFAISSGQITHPIPLDSHQMHEILLTAAQSIFAVTILLNMDLSLKEAYVLLGLFIMQFCSPLYEGLVENILGLVHMPERMLMFYSGVYIVLALITAFLNRREIPKLRYGFKVAVQE